MAAEWFDSVLHALGGFVIALIAFWLSGTVQDVTFTVTMAGLLRELAQKDKSHIVRAIISMPAWSLRGHVEWLAWGGGALIAAPLAAW